MILNLGLQKDTAIFDLGYFFRSESDADVPTTLESGQALVPIVPRNKYRVRGNPSLRLTRSTDVLLKENVQTPNEQICEYQHYRNMVEF